MTSFRQRLSRSGILPPFDAPRLPSREDVMFVDPIDAPLAPANDLIVLASSVGGMDALRTICRALPADFPAAIAIVQHRVPSQAHLLGELLATCTSLDVRDAQEGDVLTPATIFIAPADLHMTITFDRTVSLVAGGAIHHALSSADPLFASAALAYGERVTAVVLTGGDGDGSAGVRSVKHEGGTVFAQDPDTAVSGEMPRSSIATGMVDEILPLADIAGALLERVLGAVTSGRERPVSAP